MLFADLLPWHTGHTYDPVLIRTDTHSWPWYESNAPHRGDSRRAAGFFSSALDFFMWLTKGPSLPLWKTAAKEYRSILWISLLPSNVCVSPANSTPVRRRHYFGHGSASEHVYYYYSPPPWLLYATSEPFRPSIRRRAGDIKMLFAKVKIPTLINESAHTERISRNSSAIFGHGHAYYF